MSSCIPLPKEVAKPIWAKQQARLRSTKLVKCLKDTEYKERVQLLNLDSLSCRTGKGDTILVYKIRHGFLEGVQWRERMKHPAALNTHIILII